MIWDCIFIKLIFCLLLILHDIWNEFSRLFRYLRDQWNFDKHWTRAKIECKAQNQVSFWIVLFLDQSIWVGCHSLIRVPQPDLLHSQCVVSTAIVLEYVF